MSKNLNLEKICNFVSFVKAWNVYVASLWLAAMRTCHNNKNFLHGKRLQCVEIYGATSWWNIIKRRVTFKKKISLIILMNEIKKIEKLFSLMFPDNATLKKFFRQIFSAFIEILIWTVFFSLPYDKRTKKFL